MFTEAPDTSQFFDSPHENRSTSRAGRKARARHQRREEKTKRDPSRTRAVLKPMNETQAEYIDALNTSDQVFSVGPAGTGKTYLAARKGLRAVLDGLKETIYVARPAVSKAKHRLGFRPGTQDEKVADWLVPIMTGFKAESSQSTIDAMKKAGKIVFLAFETLRGQTLSDAYVILDEAQNCDTDDLKLFLTRIGDNTSVVVCGDLTQSDIPDSGLERILNMVEDFDIPADVIEFTEDDVVRSAIAKAWVQAFSKLTS